jgi:hypothetical protein
MFIRFVTIAGEKAKADAALDFMEKSVRPRVEASSGNKGLATLIAADEGLTVGASYWSDDSAMEAAEEELASLRQQAAAVAGGTLRSEEYEVAGFFRQATPSSGAVVELARFELDLTKLEQVVAIFNEDSVRCLKAAAGFYCAQLFIDREFGHGMVGTSWEDESSARAFRISARELRAQLAQRAAVTVLDPEFYRLGAM